ncbi:MAG: PHB depolymerase family esterase [Cereibacter changlensis]
MLSPFRRALRSATRTARARQKSAVKAVLLALAPPPAKPLRKKKAPAAAKTRKPAPKPKPKPPTAKPRAPLGETLRRISAGGMPARPALPRKPPAVARGARFIGGRVSLGGETRDYKLYVPAAPASGEEALLPLVVMLHGCSQTPEDFARGTSMNQLAERQRVIVAYPAQSARANAKRCWNWFRAGQPSHAAEMALIVEIVRKVLQEHPADPRRVYIAGLSAGGAAALAVASAYPEVFAAVGVHSGLPVGAAHDPASAFLAMNFGSVGRRQASALPTIVFHGDADDVVHPGNGRAVAARGLAAFPRLAEAVRRGKTGGRAFTRTRHGAPRGKSHVEHCLLHGGGHAWSGGDAAGSFTDPSGPDASREMLRFFLQHRLPGPGMAPPAG